MISKTVIIIGGGPAGAACARRLGQLGAECLILDKQKFPRTKLCAGWITPQVFDDLGITPEDYPHSLTRFRQFHIHFKNKRYTVPVHQYAIRRIEFDDWLLRLSGAEIKEHKVEHIEKEGDFFVIDGTFRCRYLVGAGGTFCPVRKAFMADYSHQLIITMEEEFPFEPTDKNCHLWFGYNDLPGYSWYVPKEGGYLNIGIGGYYNKLKANGQTIVDQWRYFTEKLEAAGLVTGHKWNGRGYNYRIADPTPPLQHGNVFIIGDAAGLATRDMGEGIRPAIQGGLLAAESIAGKRPIQKGKIARQSFAKYRVAAGLLWSVIRRRVISE